jgi:DNA-binding NtrC family response regulator
MRNEDGAVADGGNRDLTPARATPRPSDHHQIQLVRLLQSLSERVGQTTLKALVSETVGLIERHYIEAALASTDGNRSAAAKMLGLSRQSLYVKLARYGISSEP